MPSGAIVLHVIFTNAPLFLPHRLFDPAQSRASDPICQDGSIAGRRAREKPAMRRRGLWKSNETGRDADTMH
jgi:hypothetical protein